MSVLAFDPILNDLQSDSISTTEASMIIESSLIEISDSIISSDTYFSSSSFKKLEWWLLSSSYSLLSESLDDSPDFEV